MGQAKNRKAEIAQLKQATVGLGRSYGKLVKQGKDGYGNTVAIYDASNLSLEKYKAATGKLPYEIEFAESHLGLRIHEHMMSQLFDKQTAAHAVEELEVGSWRDMILVIVQKGKETAFGFRIAADNAPQQMYVPAYDQTVTLTALEVGIARMAITWSGINNYSQHYGEGPKKAVQTSAMSWTNADEAYQYYCASGSAMQSFEGGSLHRYLD